MAPGSHGPRETLAIDSAAAEAAAASIPFARSGRAGILARLVPWLLEPVEGDAVAASAATVPWTSEGRTFLTIVVKLAFSIQRGAEARLVPASAPPTLHVRDRTHKNQPLGRVTAPSDRAPYRPRVDVTLVGTAHARAGEIVPTMPVRFALRQGGALALDKSIVLVGHRATEAAKPEPFASMPLGFDRAYGGPATVANPIGRGDDPDDEQPNVLDPREPRRPAGFGPLGASWPVRARQLAGTPRKQVEAIVPDLPRSFDWGYFQHAPADQRLDALAPDASLVLEGFDPDYPTLTWALPRPRVVGAIYGLDPADADAGASLAFHADTLHVDTDAWTCEIAWRASLPVGDGVDLGALAIVVGAGTEGRAPLLAARRPDMSEPASDAASSAPRGERSRRAATVLWEEAAKAGTLSVRGDEIDLHVGTLPFQSGERPSLGASPACLAPELAARVDAEPPRIQPPMTPIDLDAPVPSSPWAREAVRSKPRSKASAWGGPAASAEPPRVAPPAPSPPAAKPDTRDPHEVVGIELHAAIASALDEPKPDIAAILRRHAVSGEVYRAAVRFWRDALRHELRRGGSALRDRFDDAYVAAWEGEHPGLFGAADYERLDHAEGTGTFLVEAEEMGIDPPLAARLRRVWRRRTRATPIAI